MPFNGSGIYNLPVTTVTPAVSGTTIDDSEFNAFTADLKDALTNCIVKDGQTSSPTLTTPSIVTPTISGSPVFTGDILLDKASPSLIVRCEAEATEDSIIHFQDEVSVLRAALWRPAGLDRLRLDVRDALGATKAALDLTEAGLVQVITGVFSATNASLTTPAMTNATGSLNGVTGSLTSPVINTGVSGTAGVSRMIQETAVATTSGTTATFGSIPSWVKRIHVSPHRTSTSGSNIIYIQIGDSGGYENTGYIGLCGSISGSTATETKQSIGFPLNTLLANPDISGTVTLTNTDGNIWAISGNMGENTVGSIHFAGGEKELTGTLDRVQLFISSNTFDNGSVNIIYEG